MSERKAVWCCVAIRGECSWVSACRRRPNRQPTQILIHISVFLRISGPSVCPLFPSGSCVKNQENQGTIAHPSGTAMPIESPLMQTTLLYFSMKYSKVSEGNIRTPISLCHQVHKSVESPQAIRNLRPDLWAPFY